MDEYNEKITLDLEKIQEGTIKVHSQIINDLSSGIYSSPASCIKELVNNSYDADAEKVIIRIKPINDTIIIFDNGNGMNAIEFDKNFAWISKSNKRNRSERSDKFNRPLIGKIGIGFIAVNEICDSMRVISSKKGEDVKFTATIDFAKIVQSSKEDRIIKGTYKLINEEEEKEEHYTIIELSDLKTSVQNILNDQQYHSQLAKQKNKDLESATFHTMKSILIHHKKKKLKTFKEESAYVNFILDLASYIPVKYIDGGPIEGYSDEVIEEIVQYHEGLNFYVDLDGIELRKPIYFQLIQGQKFAYKSFREVIPVEELAGDERQLKVKGYFFSYDHLLKPRELNGVSIRIRGIPIAVEYGFDTTFMAYPNYVDQIFRNWISGEIYIEQGLEDAMNIDRKSFRVTHPDYLALQNFLHQFLREHFFSKGVKDIYEQNKKSREEIRKTKREERKKKILNVDDVKIEVVKQKVKSTPITPIVIERHKDVTSINIDQDYRRKFKKSDWVNLEDIFVIFEDAFRQSDGDIEKLRKLFYELIAELKGK